MIMSNEEKRKLVEQWLDCRIEAFNKASKHSELPSQLLGETIKVCGQDNYIHIYNIGPIIDFMGFDVKWIDRDEDGTAGLDYKYEVQFTYKGVLFIGLYNEEGYKKWHK